MNKKKHDRLTEQVRTETKTHTVTYSGQGFSGSVSIPVNDPNFKITTGPFELFGIPAEFRQDGIYTAPSPDLKHIITTWVGFTFAGTNVNAIDLLNKAVGGITLFFQNLNKLIWASPPE